MVESKEIGITKPLIDQDQKTVIDTTVDVNNS